MTSYQQLRSRRRPFHNIHGMAYSSLQSQLGHLSRYGMPQRAGSDGSPVVKPRDFDVRPLLVIWEMTQACDLRCVHCRASAQPNRHHLELSTQQAFHLINEVAGMQVPLFVLTGGDPIKRPDLLE